MKRLGLVAILLAFLALLSGFASFLQGSTGSAPPPPTNPTFVLPSGSTQKFIATTGCDHNTGTAATGGDTSPCSGSSGQAGPWLTPNHAMNCGEVIVEAAGSYPAMGTFGTVSNCPSTTGGIDGAGGIYFAVLVCGGTLQSCTYTGTTSTGINIVKNNWAIEGMYVNSGGTQRAYQQDATSGVTHHIAFINDISVNNAQATDTDDGGHAGAFGGDYFATVGVLAQNSASDPICLAAIDVVGPGVFDTNAGTHYFVYGNFSYAHVNASCTSQFDTEDYMADTWDFHNVTTKGVFANNIGWSAARSCMEFTWQNLQTGASPTINFYGNTCFQNDLVTGTDNLDGEININTHNNANFPWAVTLQNNLVYQPLATSSGGHVVVAFALYNTVTAFTNGGSGNENFYRANRTNCTATFCNSTFDAQTFGAIGTLGTNTYTNPAFTNTADLLANWVGAPTCTGFENTAQCMGYNASTSTLTSLTPIADLVPTAGGTTGKGYQLPSIACLSSGPLFTDYPVWLKGIVYLHWNGTILTENAGLVTRPCGL